MSKNRRQHSPELKAQVGLEALKGIEPVSDQWGSLQQLQSSFRVVAGQNGVFAFPPARDALEAVLPGKFGQSLQPHRIEDAQIGFEAMAQGFVPLLPVPAERKLATTSKREG